MTTSSEIPLPTPERAAAEQPSLDMVANELLTDRKIAELPTAEQGRVIADRFIGALVRQGDIQGTEISYSAADILHLMDGIQSEEDLKKLTRTGGIRAAVAQLSSDERVGKLFGSMSSRLESQFDTQDNETFTLTSAAQIEGYLLAGGRKNFMEGGAWGIHMSGESWMGVLLDEIKRMSEDPHRTWTTTAEARNLMSSDLPSIREMGSSWEKALRTAREVGVDTELLKRSAEKLQERAKVREELGATALFISTGYKIDEYNARIDRLIRS